MREPIYYLTSADLGALALREKRAKQPRRLTAVRLTKDQEDFLRQRWADRKELARVLNG